jgi:hypothetical protein
MRNLYFLATGALLAVFAGYEVAQAQAVASLTQETPAEVEPPPFCFVCQEAYVPLCGGFIPMCTAVGWGLKHCDSYMSQEPPVPPCDAYCITWGDECFFPDFAPDGSARASALTGLSYEAAAAVLGARSTNDPMLRRPCDGTVMARRVDVKVALEQRSRTVRLAI